MQRSRRFEMRRPARPSLEQPACHAGSSGHFRGFAVVGAAHCPARRTFGAGSLSGVPDSGGARRRWTAALAGLTRVTYRGPMIETLRSSLSYLAAIAVTVSCTADCSPQPSSRQQSGPVTGMGVAPGVGIIECGPIPCDVRTGACVHFGGKPPQCVPKAQRDGYASGGRMEDAVLDCDQDADCGPGERCCAGQYWGGTGPHVHMCVRERCQDAIACRPATGCPAGLACAPQGVSGDMHCVPAMRGVACGNGRCGGATPVCCWDYTRNRGGCMAEPGRSAVCTGDDENRIRCRGRSDCGGYDCCQYMARSSDCASSCPGAAIGVLCQTMADCPPEGPGPGGARQRYDRCENGYCTGKLCNMTGAWEPCDGM